METFKRYLFFQGMMFVFGIVGPIFLVLFFASQPDPTLRWAYWWGLFITTGDILMALFLAGANTDDKKPKDAKAALAVQKRMQSGRSDTSGSSSSSSSDPFFGGAFTFASSDSGSSSDSGWFSSDSGSSSSDSGSSSDSSSSDSGSSSSSSD